jgi:DNA-binding LytR/AlgR family response regulator
MTAEKEARYVGTAEGETLCAALEGAMKRRSSYLHSVVCPGQQGDMCPILVDEVVYFSGGDRHTTVVTGAGEHRISTPLNELLTLLDPDTFWQVNRSTIVNIARIKTVEQQERDHLVVKLKERDECITVDHPFCRQFKER